MVGGGVRDLLAGVPPKDFDIATDAKPEQIRALFRSCRLVGRRFLIAHVRFGSEVLEVTTFRGPISDSHERDDSGRILSDNVYGTLEEDAFRRDFTVNGLYYDIRDFSIVDYVGGLADLKRRQLRLIGDPELRYREDPVRMLRNTMGGICDPNTAWMLMRSLETVELRMNRAGENAAKVCDFLARHSKVEGLGYLGMIKDARQQDIYNRHCKGAGSTFSLLLKGGEAECFRFLDSLKIAKLAVSLGGTETLASHPASMTHLSVAEGRRAELGISDNLVRISIGIEDADDLIADFTRALEAV